MPNIDVLDKDKKYERSYWLYNAALTLGQAACTSCIASYEARKDGAQQLQHCSDSSSQPGILAPDPWVSLYSKPTSILTDPNPSVFVLASLSFGTLYAYQHNLNAKDPLQRPCVYACISVGMCATAYTYFTDGFGVNAIMPTALILGMLPSQLIKAGMYWLHHNIRSCE